MSNQNICFHGEIRDKYYVDTHLIWSDYNHFWCGLFPGLVWWDFNCIKRLSTEIDSVILPRQVNKLTITWENVPYHSMPSRIKYIKIGWNKTKNKSIILISVLLERFMCFAGMRLSYHCIRSWFRCIHCASTIKASFFNIFFLQNIVQVHCIHSNYALFHYILPIKSCVDLGPWNVNSSLILSFSFAGMKSRMFLYIWKLTQRETMIQSPSEQWAFLFGVRVTDSFVPEV